MESSTLSEGVGLRWVSSTFAFQNSVAASLTFAVELRRSRFTSSPYTLPSVKEEEQESLERDGNVGHEKVILFLDTFKTEVFKIAKYSTRIHF